MEAEPRARFAIEDEILRYRDSTGHCVWELPVATIVVAEHTTNEGPMSDDYYLHFWNCEVGQLFHAKASFYSDGRDETIKGLEEKLDTKLELGLCGSTDWESRVVWPPELAGHPYYTFREIKPTSWVQRVKRFCLGPTMEIFYSDEVQTFLKSCKPRVQAP